jgi:hypothetical protein
MRFFKAKAPKEANVPENNDPVANIPATTLAGVKTEVSVPDASVNTTGETSKPPSEKESTLVDEPLRKSNTHLDPEKELPANPSRSSSASPSTVPDLELRDPSKEILTKEASRTESPQEDKKDDDETETPEDEEEYPSGWKLLLISIGLCLCVFCLSLVCPRFDRFT